MRYNTASPYFPSEDIEEIGEKIKGLLQGNGLLSMGENVLRFEKEFANYVGCRYAIATNSCTSSLELSLKAIGLKEREEVIVPAQTFFATGSSVAICGGLPIFCEINRNFLMDFDDLKRKITDNTKAVIIVHFAGLIHEDIFEIRNYLNDKGIILIEDSAHAHGALINDIHSGNIGDLSCFSFYSTKIMTCGEGGMITTNNEELYRACNSLRNRGIDVNADYEIFSNIGSNRRLTEIQGILGLYQLKRLEAFVGYRNCLANRYKKLLEPLFEEGMIEYQNIPDNIRHSFWRFVIILSERINRKRIQEELMKRGIKADSPYMPLLHLQPIFKRLFKTQEGMLPYSEKLAARHICLPMHLNIKMNDAEYIANSLKEIINEQN